MADKGKDLCSIVILSYNQYEYTRKCLESIRRYTRDVEYEIIVVDNASTDRETLTYLEGQTDIRLMENRENRGFAGGCNQGIEAAEGEYIVLLNNDVIVTKGWLKNMLSLLKSDVNIGMVGPLTNNTVGKQKISVPYGEDMEAMQEFAAELSQSGRGPWETLRLVGFCVLFRKALTEEMGLLDTGFEVGNYEDDDFNIRLLLSGKKSYVCRRSFVHHYMGVSFRKNNIEKESVMMRNKARLEEKWDGMDWNHHAVFNSDMLSSVIKHGGRDILHLGCGLGALEVELRDSGPDYHIVGVEDHPIRRRIAARYVDELYPWDAEGGYLRELSGRRFDVIVAEGILERSGVELLGKLRPLLKPSGLLMVRVFNIRHITTVERIVTGKVGGGLLCASSEQFSRYYGPEIGGLLEDSTGFSVVCEKEIMKTFSGIQEKLYRALSFNAEYQGEAGIYNRIFWLRPQEE